MVFVPDEMLMAYADGELAADDRRQLEAMLAVDQELCTRLAPFTATGANLANVFVRPMREPVPAQLIIAVDAALRASGAAAARSAGRGSRERGFLERARMALLESQFRLTGPAFALACAGLLIAGGASGWALKATIDPGGPETSAVLTDAAGLYASAELRAALDSLPSAHVSRLESGATISPTLSFKDHGQRFCRTYVIDTGKDVGLAGVACRTDQAAWRIPVQAELALPAPPAAGPHAGPHVSADGDAPRSPVVEKFLDGVIDGDPLGPEQEAAAIAGGWTRNGK